MITLIKQEKNPFKIGQKVVFKLGSRQAFHNLNLNGIYTIQRFRADGELLVIRINNKNDSWHWRHFESAENELFHQSLEELTK